LRDETGQATAEFALVLPVLVAVVYAIFQGGAAVNRYVTLNDAVRAAARAASLQSTYADAQAAADQAISAATGGRVTSAPVSDPQGWVSGQPVTVSASWNWAISLPDGTVVGGTHSFTSSTTQRIE
jgi:Flp pilus assembly protein TadG